MKVIASTVENEDESDEDKVYVLKSIADDLCQPQVKEKDGKSNLRSYCCEEGGRGDNLLIN